MKLTKKETAVYEVLLKNELVTRPMLLQLVWGYPADLAEKVAKQGRSATDMTVSRLKKKLPSNVKIESVYGGGYRLKVGE